MWRAFWDILRFEKIPAQYPDVNREKASVQMTEEMRLFQVLSKFGGWGLRPIFGNFSKMVQNEWT
jgi:hypothetical protein